jgi:hypothetical protein
MEYSDFNLPKLHYTEAGVEILHFCNVSKPFRLLFHGYRGVITRR